jgi:hypothetical protein
VIHALRRLRSDESGMALGLAIILVVLVGVLAAGLLTFVNTDLQSVVEVNKGQKAFEMADAGAQLAKQHLKRDPRAAHYDVDSVSAPGYLDASCNRPTNDPEETPSVPYVDGNWSVENGGMTKTFAGGQFTVTIRWLSPSGTKTECKAPEASPPEGTEYYRVVSTGTYNGARRRVEAIYNTYDIGVPRAFFTTGTVQISNNTTITDVSIFSRSASSSSVGNGVTFSGTDRAYGDWAEYADGQPNPFNPTSRCTSTPGVGAVGTLTNKQSGRDYDAGAAATSCNAAVHKFEHPRSGSNMTFPFDPNAQPALAELEAEARRQQSESNNQHYYEDSGSGSPSLTYWPPETPGTTTVVYYKFTGSPGKLKWGVPESGTAITADGCKGPLSRGVLVVENGNFDTAQNAALFRGLVVVRGGTIENGNQDGQYDDTGGSTCVEGFANADDLIKIGGNVGAGNASEVLNMFDETPGLFGVRLWSWRELYK